MRTFDFLIFYVTFIRVTPNAPMAHTYTVSELDGKCRISTAVFLRLWPFRIAMGVGRWRASGLTEAEMFSQVFSHRDIPLTEEARNRVREVVAENSPDPTDEWQILQTLDLDL